MNSPFRTGLLLQSLVLLFCCAFIQFVSGSVTYVSYATMLSGTQNSIGCSISYNEHAYLAMEDIVDGKSFVVKISLANIQAGGAGWAESGYGKFQFCVRGGTSGYFVSRMQSTKLSIVKANIDTFSILIKKDVADSPLAAANAGFVATVDSVEYLFVATSKPSQTCKIGKIKTSDMSVVTSIDADTNTKECMASVVVGSIGYFFPGQLPGQSGQQPPTLSRVALNNMTVVSTHKAGQGDGKFTGAVVIGSFIYAGVDLLEARIVKFAHTPSFKRIGHMKRTSATPLADAIVLGSVVVFAVASDPGAIAAVDTAGWENDGTFTITSSDGGKKFKSIMTYGAQSVYVCSRDDTSVTGGVIAMFSIVTTTTTEGTTLKPTTTSTAPVTSTTTEPAATTTTAPPTTTTTDEPSTSSSTTDSSTTSSVTSSSITTTDPSSTSTTNTTTPTSESNTTSPTTTTNTSTTTSTTTTTTTNTSTTTTTSSSTTTATSTTSSTTTTTPRPRTRTATPEPPAPAPTRGTSVVPEEQRAVMMGVSLAAATGTNAGMARKIIATGSLAKCSSLYQFDANSSIESQIAPLGWDSNPTTMVIGDDIMATYRGAIVGNFLFIVGLLVLGVLIGLARSYIKDQSFLESCWKSHFPGLIHPFMGAFMPVTATSTGMMAMTKAGTSSAGDIVLIVFGYLYSTVAPTLIFVKIAYQLTYSPNESLSTEQDEEKALDLLNQQQQGEDGHCGTTLLAKWSWLADPRREWKRTFFVQAWKPMLEPFSVPWFGLADWLVVISVNIIGGIAQLCERQGCCISTSVLCFVVSFTHLVLLFVYRPTLIRFDCVYFPLMATLISLLALLGLIASTVEPDRAVEVVEAANTITQVAFIVGFTGMSVSLLANILLPFIRSLKRKAVRSAQRLLGDSFFKNLTDLFSGEGEDFDDTEGETEEERERRKAMKMQNQQFQLTPLNVERAKQLQREEKLKDSFMELSVGANGEKFRIPASALRPPPGTAAYEKWKARQELLHDDGLPSSPPPSEELLELNPKSSKPENSTETEPDTRRMMATTTMHRSPSSAMRTAGQRSATPRKNVSFARDVLSDDDFDYDDGGGGNRKYNRHQQSSRSPNRRYRHRFVHHHHGDDDDENFDNRYLPPPPVRRRQNFREFPEEEYPPRRYQPPPPPPSYRNNYYGQRDDPRSGTPTRSYSPRSGSAARLPPPPPPPHRHDNNTISPSSSMNNFHYSRSSSSSGNYFQYYNHQ